MLEMIRILSQVLISAIQQTMQVTQMLVPLT